MIYFYAKEQLLLAPLKYLTSSFLCTFFIYRCFLKPPVKGTLFKFFTKTALVTCAYYLLYYFYILAYYN